MWHDCHNQEIIGNLTRSLLTTPVGVVLHLSSMPGHSETGSSDVWNVVKMGLWYMNFVVSSPTLSPTALVSLSRLFVLSSKPSVHCATLTRSSKKPSTDISFPIFLHTLLCLISYNAPFKAMLKIMGDKLPPCLTPLFTSNLTE